MWIALYDDATGRLVSLGTKITDDPNLLRGLGTLALPGPPDPNMMWDPSSRNFVPRPPKPDNLALALNHPAMEMLAPSERESLRAAIRRLA